MNYSLKKLLFLFITAFFIFLGCFASSSIAEGAKPEKNKIKAEEKTKEVVKPDKNQVKPEEIKEIQTNLPQKAGVQPIPPKSIIERDTSLKTLFEGVQIPDTAKFFQALMRGFPVSPNALGDMNQDSVVNIWDLLRVRNIWLSIGNPPTSYELVKGDLTRDGTINQEDVTLFRDVFLGKAGLPHVVDASGGTVTGGEVTITIPPGAVDTAITVSVKSVRPDSFAAENSIDLEAAKADSAWLTASFEIEAGGYEFKEPLGLEIRPYSMPPCSLREYNGLWAIGGDEDLDGLPDVYPIADLVPNQDTTALVLPPPSIPALDSLTVPGNESRIVSGPGQMLYTRPGKILRIYGSKLDRWASWAYLSNADTSVTLRALPDTINGAVGVITPQLPAGQYSLNILKSSNQSVSNSLIVEILENLPPPSDPDSIIAGYLNYMDSLYDHYYLAVLSDTMFRPDERNELIRINIELKSKISDIRDSLPNMSQDRKNQLASMISETQGTWSLNSISAKTRDENDPCYECSKEAAAAALHCTMGLEDCGAGLAYFSIFGLGYCGECNDWGGRCVTEEGYPGSWQWVKPKKGCPNCNYDRICVPISWHPPTSGYNWWKKEIPGRTKLIQHSLDPSASSNLNEISIPKSGLTNAIVSIANYEMPFREIIKVRPDGGISFPCTPSNRRTTLQMYDPETGLYDPDVLTFTTPIWAHKTWPLNRPIMFIPDTTVYYYPLALGQAKTDTISTNKPRIEYRLSVTQGQVGTRINIGFHSDEAITFRFQKPSGEFIVRDSSTTCEFGKAIMLDTTGVYKITVTYGVVGGDGPFEVGVNYYPYFPIQHLCGTIAGTLTHELSPYYAKNNVTVAVGDSLLSELGVLVTVSPGMTITNNGYMLMDNFSLTASVVDNRKTGTFSIPRFEPDNIVSGTFKNWGTLNVLSDSVVVNTGVILEESGLLTADDSLSKMRILGTLTHGTRQYALSYDTYADTGLQFKVGELVIESGGKIDVTSKGYRGINRDGWTGSRSETYPGYLGAMTLGGSHGGYGGWWNIGSGDAGSVYDIVDGPFALGAGGGGNTGGNGGGLVFLEVDSLVLNGSIIANGGAGGFGASWGSSGGAGGTINLRVRDASGTGVMQANGGAGNPDRGGGGGGGGRIAIRWQTGSTDGWTKQAQGGIGKTVPPYTGLPGGAGTVYLLGPNDGIDGRLIVDNIGRDGSTTPLPVGRTQFKYASVLGAAKLTLGFLAKQLTVLDSLLVTGSSTQLTLSDSASLTTPRMIGRSNSAITLGKGLSLNVPQMWVDGGDSLITETNLSFANATDFMLTSGGVLDNRKTGTFTIPRFEADNIVSGYFKNWGILDVLSDSIVVNTGVILEESGLLTADDSLSKMRILGTLSHGSRYYALSHDTYADTGLQFKVGELAIETTGKIDVTYRGYRGVGRDGWTGSRSETYPGYLGASNYGGSHGGSGGSWGSGDAGDVYDVVDDPFALGAGGGGPEGGYGGGLVLLEVDSLVLNGSIIANGGTGGFGYSNGSSGGAGGTINLRVRDASGTGVVQANGGSGNPDRGGGGGGGGRIAIRWQTGSIDAWTKQAQGGSKYGGGQPGGAGTIHTEQLLMTTQKSGR